MIHLTTLGTARLNATDGTPLALGGQQAKRIALVAYLALARPRGAHRRDTILGILWPELDQEHARSALRQALHGIRKSAGPDAIISQGTELIELNRAAVTCDLWALEDAAESGQPATVLELYQGELLSGLFVTDAPRFEQWLDLERSRVSNLVKNAAWAVAETADHEESERVRAVRVATSLSGFDEAALRRGMRLLGAWGAGAEALQLYERFAAEAWKELEIKPSPETRAIAAELRRTLPTPDNPDSQRAPASATEESPARARDVQPLSAPASEQSRTSPWRFIAIAGSVAIVMGVASRLASVEATELDPRRVQVESFEGDGPSSQSIARRMTTEARATLASLDAGFALAASERTRAASRPGTTVRGGIRRDDEALELRAEIIDVGSGAVLRTIVSHVASSDDLAPALRVFNDRLAAGVATALYPGWGNALSQPPSYAGYRLFVDGMRRIKAEDHSGAIASFQRAFAEDSTFTAAGLLAAMELYQVGRFALADSIVTRISPRRAQLRPVDERLLEWLTQSLKGDRIAARAAMQGVVELAPQADLAWLQLAIDNVEIARPHEALDALDHIARSAEFGEAWVGYWATRIEALHILADHERELATARTALKRHPELGVLATYELRALAALGRVDEIDRSLEAAAFRTTDPASTMRQVAMELTAHGHPGAARKVLRRALSQHQAASGAASADVDVRGGIGRTYYLLDDRATARAIYASILREHPRCLSCMGVLGVLDARDGNTAGALRYQQMIAGFMMRFGFGRPLLLQSRIAAVRGDLQNAVTLLRAAYAAGLEFDVMTHADPDLEVIKPDSIYIAFAR